MQKDGRKGLPRYSYDQSFSLDVSALSLSVLRKWERCTIVWIYLLTYCWFLALVFLSIFASCRTVTSCALLFGRTLDDRNVIWVLLFMWPYVKAIVTIVGFNWWLFPWQVFLKLILKMGVLSILHGEMFPWLNMLKLIVEDCFNKFCLLQITRNTTPMYRTPEMIDLYSNFPIGEKQDIWVRSLFFLLHHS